MPLQTQAWSGSRIGLNCWALKPKLLPGRSGWEFCCLTACMALRTSFKTPYDQQQQHEKALLTLPLLSLNVRAINIGLFLGNNTLCLICARPWAKPLALATGAEAATDGTQDFHLAIRGPGGSNLLVPPGCLTRFPFTRFQSLQLQKLLCTCLWL